MAKRHPRRAHVVNDESPAEPDELLDEVGIMLRAEVHGLRRRQKRSGRLANGDFSRLIRLTERLESIERSRWAPWHPRRLERLTEAEIDRSLADAEKEEGNAS